jgi:hypothetical protein
MIFKNAEGSTFQSLIVHNILISYKGRPEALSANL